jgi:hypothetical protein
LIRQNLDREKIEGIIDELIVEVSEFLIVENKQLSLKENERLMSLLEEKKDNLF